MHNIKANFDKIFEITKHFLKQDTDELGNIPRVGQKPKFSDVSVISLALTSEAMSIDSENYLFQKLKTTYQDKFPNLIDRSQFNVRRRKLKNYIDKVRKNIAAEIETDENVFSLDSMPVEVCKIARSNRSRLGKEDFETAPDKGFCASQQMYYYGYKLHCVCSYRGLIHSYDLTKASVHDIAYLSEVKHQFDNCLMLGDKGYLSAEIKLDLFNSANMNLKHPCVLIRRITNLNPICLKKCESELKQFILSFVTSL